MAQELTLFQSGSALSSYLDEAFADESNIQPRAGVPTLTYRGRKWATVINGERTIFKRVNGDGDEEFVGTVKVIILAAAASRGRTFYEKDFDPENPARPDCWSADGVTPDSTIQAPQALACNKCPKAIKGSKINALGKEAVACAQHRLLAVVPANNLECPPLRLRLAITSDFDSQSPDLAKAGWHAFVAYKDALRARGINHTARVVTKIKLDPNVDYPKVVFTAEKEIDRDSVPTVLKLMHSPEVLDLITDKWTPNGEDGTPTAQEPQPAQKNARTESPKVIEGEVVKENFITPEMEKEARQPAKKQPPKKQPPKEDPDEDGFGAAPAKVADKPKETPKASGGDVPEDVAALLSEWGS